jgi:hypothetical protein
LGAYPGVTAVTMPTSGAAYGPLPARSSPFQIPPRSVGQEEDEEDEEEKVVGGEEEEVVEEKEEEEDQEEDHPAASRIISGRRSTPVA